MGSSDDLLQPLMLSWGTWRTCLWIRLTLQRLVCRGSSWWFLVTGHPSLQVIGTFLARAVADDCVPPLYLGKNPLPNELAKLVGRW